MDLSGCGSEAEESGVCWRENTYKYIYIYILLIRTNHKATSIRSMLEGTLKSKYNACRHCSKSGGLAGSAPARSPRWLAEDSHKFRTRLWTAVRSVERRRKRAWQLLGGEKKLGPAPVCVIHNICINISLKRHSKYLTPMVNPPIQIICSNT